MDMDIGGPWYGRDFAQEFCGELMIRHIVITHNLNVNRRGGSEI
jgi:hypothetical protein